MKKILNVILTIISIIMLYTSCDNYEVPVAKNYEGIISTRIWDKERHSAFTSLIRYNGYFYCAFREGVSHVGDGGVVRIIKSKDGITWETSEVLRIESSGDTEKELSFSGQYQNMVIKYHSDFDFTKDESFSATAFVNLAQTSSTAFIIGNRNGGNGFELAHNNGELFFDFSNPYLRFYQTPKEFTPNVWHHIGFVYDGTNKTLTLYQDGRALNVGIYPTGNNIAGQENTYGNDIVLFSKAPNHKTNPVGYHTYTKGQISFLRFWDKALNSNEIISDRNLSVTPTTPNLISAYDFSVREQDGNSFIIPDIKGKHPGILRNFVKDDFSPPTDLRDPKLSVTSDNRIMVVVDGEFYRSGTVASRRPYISFSDTNGENFSELAKSDVYYPTESTLSDRSFWMWSHFSHKDTYYAFDYLHFILFKSTDVGKTFYPIKRLDYESIGERPTETELYIDSNDKMYAFIRRTNANGYLATSLPPYTDWSYKELDYRVEGQKVIPLNDNYFLIGTRRFDENNANPQVAVYVTDLEGEIKKEFVLPSSGDCSYPGMVLDDGFLWISYYSSHEGRTSIYFTKIPVSDLS